MCAQERRTRVLLVAGGTGGHIIPAVAFGNWIKKRHVDVDVDYMSGSRRLELDIYDKSGIKPLVLDMEGSPLGAPKGKRVSRWLGVAESFFRAKDAIVSGVGGSGRYDLCVMFGGYISAPALLACKLYGVKALLHEQNARAGIVTRFAGAMNVTIASGWDICEPLKKGDFAHTGIPVRCIVGMEKEEAWRELGLPGDLPEGPIAAVTTGSIGSSSVGEAMKELAQKPEFGAWAFLIVDPGVESPEMAGKNMFRLPRRWDVAPLYSAADMLVTRAGASTLAEAVALGIPTLSIPWREAAKDHQMQNALQAARIAHISIWDEKSGNALDLSRKIGELGVSQLSKNRDITKRMYNASDNICGRLWSLADATMRGEIHVEGR